MNQKIIAIILPLASVAAFASPLSMPASGHVYLERVDSVNSGFSPLARSLLIVARLRSCNDTPGSRSVDEYLVRTTDDGFFQIPEKTIDLREGCTVTLLAQVVSPFLRSLPARVAGNPDVGQPQRYKGLEYNDVVARDKKDKWHKHEYGQIELQHWLSTVIGQARISREERVAAYREMLPEICHVLKEDPTPSNLNFPLRDDLLYYFSESELECLTINGLQRSN